MSPQGEIGPVDIVAVMSSLDSVPLRVSAMLCSGYHDAAIDLAPNSYQGFLIKPCTLAQLFETVQKALAVSR